MSQAERNNETLLDLFNKASKATIQDKAAALLKAAQHPSLPGFDIINNRFRKKDRKQNTGVTLDAFSSQDDYASTDLNSRQQMGAALERSIQWYNDIVNKYPTDFEQVFESYVETLQIKHRAKLDGTFMKAPNGKPTNLTERQWLQVRTPAFKNWFGDWEITHENAAANADHCSAKATMYLRADDYAEFEQVLQHIAD